MNEDRDAEPDLNIVSNSVGITIIGRCQASLPESDGDPMSERIALPAGEATARDVHNAIGNSGVEAAAITFEVVEGAVIA